MAMSSNQRPSNPTRLSFLLAVLLSAPGAAADPVDDMAPGVWLELPGTQLRAVMPDPLPPADSGAKGLFAWSSAALDPAGEQLLVTGGGHRDYGGNEVYSFSLRTLQWSRIWGPSPEIPPTGWEECTETYADGNPVSRHTYDGLEFIQRLGLMYVFGGGLYCGYGIRGIATWTFDPVALEWQRRADIPDGPYEGFTFACDDDPDTGSVYCLTTRRVLRYDPYDDTFETLADLGGGVWDDRTTAVLAPDFDLLVVLSEDRVLTVDVSTGTVTDPQPTTGGEPVLSSRIRGFDWDPTLGRLVAWAGGARVYSLDPETWQWFVHEPAATNTLEPTTEMVSPSGLYGRFRYVPSRNVYILVAQVDTNVYLYRLSEGTGSPVPPPEPREDAGVGADSGLDAGAPDGSVRDAAIDQQSDTGGCGCRSSLPTPAAPALLLLPVGLARKRRKRPVSR